MLRLPPGFSQSCRRFGFYALLLAVISLSEAAQSLSQTSAYLQGFADSPVSWQPWSESTFAHAKQQGKPIYLTIGTATSELSRAMQRQSLANPETATFLNENFVCIAIDAKERPDVFALYQNYLQTTKQVSGPPLNLWLTPELKPFEGANYLPPTEEWGKEGFITTVKRTATAWKTDADAQRRKADEACALVAGGQVATVAAATTPAEITAVRASAVEAVRARADGTHGGFGEPPKYPEPELLRALLSDAATRDLALATLRQIIESPLQDPLDGGFFRYTVDAEWRQPYFQKLLIDQPRLALALLDAAKVSGDARYADAARSALRFTLDTMRSKDGDYAAALDATAEAAASTHFWSIEELEQVLGAARAKEFNAAYGATREGNVAEDSYPGLVTKGKNLLRRVAARGSVETEKQFAADLLKLRQSRVQRGVARRDEGATSGAHGLLLVALCRAGKQLSDPALVAAAKAESELIRGQLLAKDGRLLRLAHQPFAAAPLDYAFVIDGLFSFSATTGDREAERVARALLAVLDTSYRDPKTDRYLTVATDAGPAFWAKLAAPTATAGEIVSTEAALLTAARTNGALKAATERLVPIVAADLRNAVDAPVGELLLALTPAD